MSRKYNAPFLFETNVGAGLPIIDTLKHLIASGDKVNKIQSRFVRKLETLFLITLVKQIVFMMLLKKLAFKVSQNPIQKIDLSGIDVARKILILIRESGYQMEIEDIVNKPFLPTECMNTTDNESFLLH